MSKLTALDYALNVAHVEIDTTTARDELAAMRQSVEELEKERDMLFVESKLCENYRQRLQNLRIMLGCSINDLPVKVKELTERVAELERERDAARSGHDYAVAEQAKSTAYITELLQERSQSAQAIFTPNNCRHCQRSEEKMREAAAKLCDDYNCGNEEFKIYNLNYGKSIRAMPLPACDGCNPLKPDAEKANQADSLQAWGELWTHIVTQLGSVDELPNAANFDAMLLQWTISQ